MKKITLLLAVMTVTLSLGQELLTAGGFEGLTEGDVTLSTSPWLSPNGNNNPGKVKIINDNALAHSGDQFLFMDNDFRNLRQAFTAVQNTGYTVTFWYQFPMIEGQITDPDDGMYISVRDNTSGGNGAQFNPQISFYVNPSLVNNTWQQATFNFTAPISNLLFFVSKQDRNADGDSGLNNAVRLDDFSITPSLSIEDLAKFNFKSSPNPTRDYINLSASNTIDKVEIFSLLGQQVMKSDINDRQSRLDVSTLSRGIYILKAYIEDAEGSYKFVKE